MGKPTLPQFPGIRDIIHESISAQSALNMPTPYTCSPHYVAHSYEHIQSVNKGLSYVGRALNKISDRIYGLAREQDNSSIAEELWELREMVEKVLEGDTLHSKFVLAIDQLDMVLTGLSDADRSEMDDWMEWIGREIYLSDGGISRIVVTIDPNITVFLTDNSSETAKAKWNMADVERAAVIHAVSELKEKYDLWG